MKCFFFIYFTFAWCLVVGITFPGLNDINIDFFQIQGASILGIPLIVTEQVGINKGQACDIDSAECSTICQN